MITDSVPFYIMIVPVAFSSGSSHNWPDALRESP